MNLYGYTANDPINNTDPTGKLGWMLVNLTKNGMVNGSKLTFKQAVRARRQGLNVLASNRQNAGKVERAAADNPNDVLRHSGHKLDDGSTGRPHYQNDVRRGHTFWASVGAVIVGLLDPSDAMACGELDCDGDGVEDWKQPILLFDTLPTEYYLNPQQAISEKYGFNTTPTNNGGHQNVSGVAGISEGQQVTGRFSSVGFHGRLQSDAIDEYNDEQENK